METGKNSKEFIKAWLKRAKADLKSAEDLLRCEDFADSTYHSQQAAEKACKALLIAENVFVEKHKISKWFKKVFSEKLDENVVNEIIKNVRDLEKHWIKPKYPFIGKGYIWDPTKEYTKEIAEDALRKAKVVLNAIEKILKDNYRLSFGEGR